MVYKDDNFINFKALLTDIAQPVSSDDGFRISTSPSRELKAPNFPCRISCLKPNSRLTLDHRKCPEGGSGIRQTIFDVCESESLTYKHGGAMIGLNG
ncbi:hypothetical protein H0E87_009407 [Populus deltoides]|uniref:Uncharacterized protein n=1 Tax=Populus deltoides TaxID=3696 RepID=A0A8T2Z440_POPDE|nr:hypothetical protein H0E87_009407 [Populus deltoides]